MRSFRGSARPTRTRFVMTMLVTAVAVAFAMTPTRAIATVMQYLTIEDLTGLSSDIFRGQVVSTSVSWGADHKRIYTSVRVRVEETFKGSPRVDQVITVTQLGGEKDGIRMDYAGRPEFAVGEEVALFTVRGGNDD